MRAITNVIANRTGEKKRVLENDTHLSPQRVLGNRANVNAVNRYRAVSRIVESADEFDERGFARAGLADQRDGLSRGHAQVNSFQHWRRIVRIVKTDVAEIHIAANRRQFRSGWRVADFNRRVE